MSSENLTVLVPVMNGSQYLDRKIESLKNSFLNYTGSVSVLISVNLSSDDSYAKVLALVGDDNRFKVFSHQQELSMLENFRFLLRQSDSEYICFSAVDDFTNELFFSESIEMLKNNPESVGSKAKATFFPPVHGSTPIAFSIVGNEYERCKVFIQFRRVSHAVNYAVFRKKYLEEFMVKFNKAFIGYDWTWGLWMASKGPILETPNGMIEFTANGVSRNPEVFKILATNKLDRYIPYLKLSASVLRIAVNVKYLKTKLFLVKFSIELIIANLNRQVFKIINKN